MKKRVSKKAPKGMLNKEDKRFELLKLEWQQRGEETRLRIDLSFKTIYFKLLILGAVAFYYFTEVKDSELLLVFGLVAVRPGYDPNPGEGVSPEGIYANFSHGEDACDYGPTSQEDNQRRKGGMYALEGKTQKAQDSQGKGDNRQTGEPFLEVRFFVVSHDYRTLAVCVGYKLIDLKSISKTVGASKAPTVRRRLKRQVYGE